MLLAVVTYRFHDHHCCYASVRKTGKVQRFRCFAPSLSVDYGLKTQGCALCPRITRRHGRQISSQCLAWTLHVRVRLSRGMWEQTTGLSLAVWVQESQTATIKITRPRGPCCTSLKKLNPETTQEEVSLLFFNAPLVRSCGGSPHLWRVHRTQRSRLATPSHVERHVFLGHLLPQPAANFELSV